MAVHKLTDVAGIGPKTAEGLATLGIDSVTALAAAPVELISTLPGFFPSRAEAVKAAAGDLAAAARGTARPSSAGVSTAAGEPGSGTSETKKKKKKKKKKDKKKGAEPKKKGAKSDAKAKKSKKADGGKKSGKGKKKSKKKKK